MEDGSDTLAEDIKAILDLADPDSSTQFQMPGFRGATTDSVTSATYTQSSTVTMHTHTGGASSDKSHLVADQEGDYVFGVGTLSNGSRYVVAGDAGYQFSGLPYGTITNVRVFIADTSGNVTSTTLNFSGGQSPINSLSFEVVMSTTPLSGGGLVITDSVSKPDNSASNSYYEVLSNTGSVTKSWTALSSDGHANSNAIAHVLPTSGGGFVVAWNENNGADGYYQRFNASGTATDTAQHFVVNDSSNGWDGRVAVDPNGDVMVGLNANSGSQQYAIYGSNDSLITKQTYVAAESGLLTASGGTIENSGNGGEDFISLSGGGFLTTVFAPTSDGHMNQYVQKISVSGSTVTWGTPAFTLQGPSSSFAELIEPVQLSNGKILLQIWSDGVGLSAPSYELIDPADFPGNNSTQIDYSTPVIGSTSPSGSSIPLLAADNSGGVVAAILKSTSGLSVSYSYGYGVYDATLYVADFDPASNTPPTVDLNGASAGTITSLSYTENGAATAIAPSGTVTDSDSADFNGGSLTVSFTANGTTADQLTIQNQGTSAGQIGVSGSNVTFGGTTIGTFTGGTNGTNLVITFNSAAATPAAAQALLEHILYANSSDNPSTAARSVTFTVSDGDGGTSTGVAATINVTAVNDPAVISGTITGSVTEKGGVANGTAGTATATGTLTDTDVDNTANTFTAVSTATASTGGHGTFVMTTGGQWTYTLNDNDSAVQALNIGDTLSDSFSVTTADGTSQTIAITIHGANDAATISGTATGSVTEASGVNNATAGVATATGTLTDTDPDDTANTFTAVSTATASTGGHGTFVMTTGGQWTYTLNDNDAAVQALNTGGTLSDSFSVTTADGTSQIISITIHGADDAAVAADDAYAVNANGVLNIAAVAGVLHNDSDVDGPSPTVFSVDGVTASVGQQIALADGSSLTLNTDGSLVYDPNHEFDTLAASGSDATDTSAQETFTYAVDGGASATVTITVNGVDSASTVYVGGSGNDHITGGNDGNIFDLTQGGSDTATGGSGNDGFKLGGAFDSGDHIDGGGGTNNQVQFDGTYGSTITIGSAQLTNIQVLAFGPTHSYTVVTDGTLTAAGQPFTFWSVSMPAPNSLSIDAHQEAGNLAFYLGQGDDTVQGGSGSNLYYGEGGSDVFTAGGGPDTFAYLHVSDSNLTASHDSILDFTAGTDQFKLIGMPVVAVDATISGTATDLTTLQQALTDNFGTGAAHELAANHAAIFHVTSGGQFATYDDVLVVNAHGAAGYSAGSDYVMLLGGLTGTLTTSDFVT